VANVKESLCPSCGACPEVEIVGEEVRIGEAGNLAVLKKDEWNALVELIRAGKLSRPSPPTLFVSVIGLPPRGSSRPGPTQMRELAERR
jgi:predicted molibdopterin-dependent oxidoreductase YjgC